MRILLIGKNGQLGFELARRLSPLGDLTSFDRASFDLTRPDKFRLLIRELRPQVIVNAAAHTAVDRAESEPDLAFSINSRAPGVIAEEAKRLDALLIHFSTDYVFDGTQTRPYHEDDEPNPQSVYGLSKLQGERAIQASSCRHLILRISWVYGEHGSNFLRTILKLAQTQPVLRVVNDQWGAPTSTLRLAEVTTSLLARLHAKGSASNGSRGLFHLSPAGCASWYAFAQEIKSLYNLESIVLPTTTEFFPRPAKRPANSLLDNSRFLNEFNLSLGHWRCGLSEVFRSVQASGNWIADVKG